MACNAVAISMGSTRDTTVNLPWLRISEIWFPAGAALPSHTHDRPVFAVALDGALDSRLPGRRLDCERTSVWTEPAGEVHSNSVGRTGARVLALLPDPRSDTILGPCAPLLDAIHHWRHGGVAGIARRIADELRGRDAATPLALEGLALEALALGLRSRTPARTEPLPHWLRQARDILHDRMREPIDIAELAGEVGVPPGRLARAFRGAFGLPLGSYHRRIRLDWAARQLAQSRTPIGTIALRAGFYDQAHFTRHFRRHTGATPAEYRRARG